MPNRKWPDIPNFTWDYAQQLRREQTASEKLLWKHLRNEQLGVKIRRQHPIGPFVADFYVQECNLVIELDGDSHFSEEQQAYDLRRSAYLLERGITVIRFQNHQVKQSLSWVVEQIRLQIEMLKKQCQKPPLIPPKFPSQLLGET
ncbi:MAG: endonuclease domain-containing protein [bacterium]|nr:endonuclease domain-containing protein [bacterium]